MVGAFEDYVNWWPGWYGCMTIFVGFGCGISAVHGFADGGRFGSGYYRLKMIKGLLGVVLCMALLWPIPFVIFFIRLLFRFNMSEIEEVEAYERKAFKKRGLDYDEEVRKERDAQWAIEDAERDKQWRQARDREDAAWELENLRRQAEEAEAKFGELYFGGR